MKVLNLIMHPITKFSKGMLVLLMLNTLVVICVFVFDACKKSVYEHSPNKKANDRFMAALLRNKKKIGDVSLSRGGHTIMTTAAGTESQTSEVATEPIYLSFPTEVNAETYNMFQNTNSIQELADLVQRTDAIVQYQPTSTNSNFALDVPVETVSNSLSPLVQESKQYLYSRGFTEQEIQQMIAENNATEADLIPLVMSIISLEPPPIAHNYLALYPINTAYANMTWSEVGRCAIHAIGVDILFSLGSSTATVWTVAAIKTAFKTVAKRMLGPIGIAIAVIDFGLCLGGVDL